MIKQPLSQLKLKVVNDYETMSDAAAEVVISYLQKTIATKGRATLVPSAGGTPDGLYRRLRSKYIHAIDWKKVTVIQMDDYAGLSITNPNSLAYYLQQKLVEPLGIIDVHYFYNQNGKLNKSLIDYDAYIEELGGVDLFINGIGQNGHLGYNEPGTPFDSTARIIPIAQNTRIANSRFFASLEDVPTHGVTLGLQTFRNAGMNLVIASGKKKLDAIHRMLREPMTADLPASCLQQHPATMVIVDEAAYFKTKIVTYR